MKSFQLVTIEGMDFYAEGGKIKKLSLDEIFDLSFDTILLLEYSKEKFLLVDIDTDLNPKINLDELYSQIDKATVYGEITTKEFNFLKHNDALDFMDEKKEYGLLYPEEINKFRVKVRMKKEFNS